MKNNKILCPNDITCKFFKFCWNDLCNIVTRAITCYISYELLRFSEPNKLGILT